MAEYRGQANKWWSGGGVIRGGGAGVVLDWRAGWLSKGLSCAEGAGRPHTRDWPP